MVLLEAGSLLRCSFAGWIGELRLHKHLLYSSLSRIVLLVDHVHLLHQYTMADHLEGVELPFANHVQEFLPVQLNWSLSIANESDPSLHQGADIKVICLEKIRYVDI